MAYPGAKQIEIDLAPIRPDAQLISRQHLVVGTIHYHGADDPDRGTLIYIKPTLTGDEPGDIQQYRTRNAIFPHEPTSDQFFAEAQWESYRRLGEHIGRKAFAFVKQMDERQRERAETGDGGAERHRDEDRGCAGAASGITRSGCAPPFVTAL